MILRRTGSAEPGLPEAAHSSGMAPNPVQSRAVFGASWKRWLRGSLARAEQFRQSAI